MRAHRVAFALLLAALATASLHAQSPTHLLIAFRDQPNDLARRQYLLKQIPALSPADRSVAQQLLATVDANLGLYDQALHDFPFDNRIALRRPLPWAENAMATGAFATTIYVHGAGDVVAVNAADAVAKLATQRRIVLVNEAHHDAHTRVLALELLPKLRALGFDYFAAEALLENGTTLAKRGYPLDSSGTVYLREPLYGDIVREAIRLGYKIIAYDPTTDVPDRDKAQAEALYQKVFAHDSQARLFVLAGYAHIDKAKGHLGGVEPMAMRLRQITGFDPLSVDQTQFREVIPSTHTGPYSQITEMLHSAVPFVMQSTHGNRIWSADPARYDVSVVIPPASGEPRPDWLTLGGKRRRWPISTTLCHDVTPCVVEADYANEPDTAVPADRYTFLRAPASSELFLRPGDYRLRAWGLNGVTLVTAAIRVGKR